MDTQQTQWAKAYLVITLMLAIISCQPLRAQDSLSHNSMRNPKLHKAWVRTLNGEKFKGYLMDADSMTITLVRHPKRHPDVQWTLLSEDIGVLKVRRRGKVLRGAGIGLLAGAFTGFMTGYLDGDDPPCNKPGWGCLFYVQSTAEEKGLVGAILLSIPGAITGTIIGTGRKKFNISGNSVKYWNDLPLIRTYTINAQLEYLLPPDKK